MASAVKFEGLRKEFGKVVAVDGIDLEIPHGSFTGIIGHNGAGKTTTLRMLMGLLRPTAGKVYIDGIDVVAEPRKARTKLGAVPEEAAVYPYLTAREYLEFIAEVRGGGDVESALELTGLGDDADRLLREYSQGMRRKTALAAALLGKPPVLVLDESLNGLDPPSAARVKATLRELAAQGTAVLLSTHVVETVQAAADRVVMLAHGRIVADVHTDGMAEGELEEMFVRLIEETRDEGR